MKNLRKTESLPNNLNDMGSERNEHTAKEQFKRKTSEERGLFDKLLPNFLKKSKR